MEIKRVDLTLLATNNKEVDRLIEVAKSEIDPVKFGEIYQKIFKLITKDNPYIFLYIPNSITAVNKRIEGIKPSIIGIMYNFIDWKVEIK